jgi:hypothetical protein
MFAVAADRFAQQGICSPPLKVATLDFAREIAT